MEKRIRMMARIISVIGEGGGVLFRKPSSCDYASSKLLLRAAPHLPLANLVLGLPLFW